MKKTTTSKKFSLNWLDFVKGLAVACVTGVIATCGQVFEVWATSPTFTFDKVSTILIIKAAIAGGGAYLVKNFITPAKTVITQDPNVETK